MLIIRTYRETISDALEACFSFKEGLNSEEYLVKTELPEGSYIDALKTIIEIEEKIQKFYGDAALMSESLMADCPRTFKIMVKKRDDRKLKLKSLIGKSAL